MVLTVIYALIIFCLLIFVHEFGHFAACKIVGIRVREFAIGMGPLLFQFTKGETKYSLRALPIGGYCAMEGEDESSSDPKAFGNKPAWARAIVIVAGSFMNLLTALIIITIMAMSMGVQTTTIGELTEGAPAEAAGLLPGDRIVQVEGTNIESWSDILDAVSGSAGESISVVVERDGQTLTFATGVAADEAGRRIIGIMSKGDHSLIAGLKAGYNGCFMIVEEMFRFIGTLFTGGASVDDVVGPVGIVSIISDQAKLGVLYVAQFAALISINLAIVNMLPLPALDGGRLLFLIIRLFTRGALTDEVEGKIHLAGMVLLLGLMAFLVYHDVGRFILN